jgi:anaerobic selenocysteine-containing dehydrogenase
MNAMVKTACPHDCPSACSLEVERIDARRIGAVRGDASNTYTDGVICAKVARYAERVHHPERLKTPLARIGAKGEGRFAPIAWDTALDRIAEAFQAASAKYGSETVWPYHSGGTMGIVQRYGLERFRNVLRYSRQQSTICSTPAETGWRAGIGALTGADPREMADAELIFMWGGNPVSTQVNAMTHIQKARKKGARLVVVDVYRSPSIAAADRAVIVRPGTDGALACAMIHVLLRDGLADRDYLARLTDWSPAIEAHFAAKTPEWAAAITGLPAAEIVELAHLYGSTKRCFLRVGFGFTRSRNGSVNMHAVSCLPAVTGSWTVKGGGAFFMTWDLWRLDTKLAWGLDALDTKIRIMDQSRIGPVLTGAKDALKGGPPVTAMLVQNANSATVAPDSTLVRRGLARDDLFLVVHEQFLTETAKFADIVLPATMFLEHDDLYWGYGHTHGTIAPKVIEPYAECRPNHDVTRAIARRLGAKHPGFDMTAWEIIDATLRASGYGSAEEVRRTGWIDCAPPFERAHFLTKYPTATGRFRFAPDWAAMGPYHAGLPPLPDHVDTPEWATAEHPFRLVTSPARTFLNSTFSETESSRRREGKPHVKMHPTDAARLGFTSGDRIRLGNRRGQVVSEIAIDDGQQPGVLVAEGLWRDPDFAEGRGINHLTGADPVPPNGGVAFHDTAVWVRAVN